ncbi:MAG: acyl-CoA dehydrogenase [Bdellovibrionales bacterium]|nr:acyl-CoA dehydrogenase [Bdellovibrionales bacterium]
MEQLYGIAEYYPEATCVGVALGVLFLAYLGVPFLVWAIGIQVALWIMGAPYSVMAGVAIVSLIGVVPPIRQWVLSKPIMNTMKALKVIPVISETERTALEAGVVWVEKDLFSGKPNFKHMMQEPYPELTDEEKAFIEGPCQELCGMLDDWKIHKNRDLSKESFEFMKKNKFFGLIIPKEYGGLEFSAAANSEVVQMIATRSTTGAITVMVPNSLGPAELLTHYGTEAQKKRYLPRLAVGDEVPCFALTEPQAGSDAGSITSSGVVFKNDAGELCVRLNWNKRWITLAAISTLLGMAFKLRDPENLLGQGEDLGITCALVPSHYEGVVIGRRHDPLGVPFYNCPTQGRDVVIKIEDDVIGGMGGVGKGWGMLMESLGAGRGISLPASAAGGLKLTSRIVTNHAMIRKQFGLPIGKFEGVEEPLARIVGSNYYVEALRKFTLSPLNQGIKPPIVTAMAKYNATEIGRHGVNDGMDILGGSGISLGPKNLLGQVYMGIPIGITVEGANILTRTLMVFGQGALRAHPFAFDEVNAVERGDLSKFDKAFWGHIGHVVRNTARSIVLSLTRGHLASRGLGGPSARYFQKLSWASASFAIMADLAMGFLGGKLKVKEKLTGRFADIFSYLYIGAAVLRRFEADGRRKEDLPYLHYSMAVVLQKIQESFEGLFANFEAPLLNWFFRGPLYCWARLNGLGKGPSDALAHEMVKLALTDSEQRDRMHVGLYYPKDMSESLAHQEATFKAVTGAEDVVRKVKKAVKAKVVPRIKGNMKAMAEKAMEAGVITQAELDLIEESEKLRWESIQVDDFDNKEFSVIPY